MRSATELGECFPFGGRGGRGSPAPELVVKQVPGARDLDPAAIDRLEPAGPDGPGIGLLERHQAREMCQTHAGLHLAGVVVLCSKDRCIDVTMQP